MKPVVEKILRREGIILLVVALASFFFYHNISGKKFITLDDYYAQEISWSKCYDTFQCATYKVPIDYSAPEAGSFTISAMRRVADDTAHRIGSLIVNPGGPGASGIDYAYNAEYVFSPDITDRYDIVGFDPRGVSRSTPITCYTNKETDENYASDAKPDNAAELKAAIAESKSFIEKCLEKTPHLTAFSTAGAARDMDILRALVGDEKLNYMGKSYGTFMGTLYAQFFPDRIGRVVFDGAVDPGIDIVEQVKMQAVGFDLALRAFIDDCAKAKSCPLPHSQSEALKTITQLFHSASMQPLRIKNDSRVLGESLMVIGTASALYDSDNGWPELRKAIAEAQQGKGDTFIQLADMYTGRDSDGTYPNNEFDAGAVIDCLDFTDHRTISEMKRDAAAIAKAAPIFGPYLGYTELGCSFMPKNSPVVVKQTTTTAPVVIIGTTNDPATPYTWAKSLATLLPNSRLLTLVGDGHTGQGRGNACIDDVVDKYYLTGTLPAASLSCRS